jgi:hypothetical protein
MKHLTPEQVQTIKNALQHYAKKQEELIDANYLEIDREEQVADAQSILAKCDELSIKFYGDCDYYFFDSSSMTHFEGNFQTAENIYQNENYSALVKAGRLMGIIDSLNQQITTLF